MSQTIHIHTSELTPGPAAVLRQMGVPRRAEITEPVRRLVAAALDLFNQIARPEALTCAVSRDTFATVYQGEGRNAEDSPLRHIYPCAEGLALYALTLGSEISGAIEQLSQAGDIALGGALDAAASVAADAGAELLEKHFQGVLQTSRISGTNARVLAYSPGYCGWHVSGQRRLFAVLQPERIGITLNKEYLMHPIKSVSGVLVGGTQNVHQFKPHWDFCKHCTTYACLQRMKRLERQSN